jgi:predicted ATP-grasp superfamily ATP-dependent carboligase
MDITQILSDLTAERNKLDQAIQALEGSLPRRGRPPKSSGKRTMSADARRRIGLAMKLAWAKRKGQSAPKKAAAPAKKSTVRRPMSPAMKKKMSALMKARWAEKKKAGAKSL